MNADLIDISRFTSYSTNYALTTDNRTEEVVIRQN